MVYRSAALSGLIGLGFAVIFVADLYGFFEITPNPVAFVRRAEGTVRYLQAGRLSWTRAQYGTLLAVGDTVLTAESDAQIDFFEGAELDLERGTMIIIGGGLGEVRLDFVRGGGELRVARRASAKIALATPKAAARREVADSAIPRIARFRTPKALLPEQPPARPLRPASVSAAVNVATLRNPASALSTAGTAVRSTLPILVGLQPANGEVIKLEAGQSAFVRWSVDTKSASVAANVPLKYEVEFRPELDQGPPRLLSSEHTELALAGVPSGRYLWSVRAVGTDGTRGPSSSPRWLELQQPAEEIPAPREEPRKERVQRRAPVVEKPTLAKPRVVPVKVE